ncbi:MAG: hypothetical protein IPO43_16685 [Rhodoferax sp.]|nr:hypothetical protein [Rhodoferax sp.]
MAEYAQQPGGRHRPRGRRPALLAASLAAVCGLAALALAWHYPLLPVATITLVLIGGVAFFAQPSVWLLVLPALLPLVGLAPWTGWISFEEQDLLLLTAATGAYARMAWEGRPPRQRGAEAWAAPSAWLWVPLVVLFALATVASMWRGFADAGGFQFGWFQGYHEPMNSVRLAKSFLAAVLMLPLWLAACRADPQRASRWLSWGLMGGLVGACLATIWERIAFTGLLNFSSDYRTTGLFWEMHVGGAALDGFLALTVPFALRELLLARTPARWVAAAGAMALAAYACLTTFSRGVYLAVPVGAVVLMVLHARQSQRADATGAASLVSSHRGWSWAAALAWAAAFGAGAAWMFPSSGYRGMAALLATLALALPLARVLRGLAPAQWWQGLALGAGLSLITGVVAWLVPKGAYIGFGLVWVLTVAALARARRAAAPGGTWVRVAALAGFMAAVTGAVLVAQHWGGAAGGWRAAPVLLAALAVALLAGLQRQAVWPDALRWQAGTLGLMATLAVVVGIFGGGSYMSERFSTGGQDFGGRLAHWKLGRDLLAGPGDWALGKGLGRFPANHFLVGNPQQIPGDYRLNPQDSGHYLTLSGGKHVNGWGELLRVTQRVSPPGRTATVTARVRVAKAVSLHFEVCEKHLLYNQSCLIKQTQIKAAPGVWQSVRVELKGDPVSRGAWYAPRLVAFSMAMESLGGIADLDDVSLVGGAGQSLLDNGDFSEGMAHWFFSSDRHHMPWHIKSMFMHVLFDQGIVGAALWGLLLVGALWRVSLGSARQHPLAPALAASLIGFAVVGLFDSLLDVPRLAWLFYLLLLVALTLRGPLRSGTAGLGARGATSLVLLVIGCGLGLQPGEARAQAPAAIPPVIQVGPTRAIKTIAEAARLVSLGGTIEVDSGDYPGDVAVWQQDDVTIRAIGGRVRLLAQGAAAEGKGIWVVRAQGMRVEGFDFEGASVPARNGAGIRFERGSLLVRDCRFLHNEMGLLTNNDAASVLEVEDSEFAHNQRPDGHNHNLYAGRIARLSVKGSYLHHARTGHLLKSRAAVNDIRDNRLTDEDGGTASYELEFPEGGVAHVRGNLIAQSRDTQNPILISFGAEGYKWPRNELVLEHNTLVNPLSAGGAFLRVATGATRVLARHNRLVGPGRLEAAGPGDYHDNLVLEPAQAERVLRDSLHNPGSMSHPALPTSR